MPRSASWTKYDGSCGTPIAFLERSSGESSARLTGIVSLDSSFLLELGAGEPSAVGRAARPEQSRENPRISAPAVSEVMADAYGPTGSYLAVETYCTARPGRVGERACWGREVRRSPAPAW